MSNQRKQILDEDAFHQTYMNAAPEFIGVISGRTNLSNFIEGVLQEYLARTAGNETVEYRWTDTGGTLRNRDGLQICGHRAEDGAACIREAGHIDTEAHIYRNRVITK